MLRTLTPFYKWLKLVEALLFFLVKKIRVEKKVKDEEDDEKEEEEKEEEEEEEEEICYIFCVTKEIAHFE